VAWAECIGGVRVAHQRDDNAAINLARWEELHRRRPSWAAVKRGADRKTRLAGLVAVKRGREPATQPANNPEMGARRVTTKDHSLATGRTRTHHQARVPPTEERKMTTEFARHDLAKNPGNGSEPDRVRVIREGVASYLPTSTPRRRRSGWSPSTTCWSARAGAGALPDVAAARTRRRAARVNPALTRLTTSTPSRPSWNRGFPATRTSNVATGRG